MREFAEQIINAPVTRGSFNITFMGQAGIIIKTDDGALTAIDLYLSDCCKRLFGFKRLMPTLLDAQDIAFDCIITTHAHYDHFDIDSMSDMMSNGKTRLLTADDGREECEKLGLDSTRITYMQKHKVYNSGIIRVNTLDCDHGELAPHALGLYLQINEKTVYISGDTCYNEQISSQLDGKRTDIMFAPINGAFGNMNERECADFIAKIKPGLAVPYHFWNFAQHGGDPDLFMKAMDEYYPSQRYELLRMGETLTV